MRIIQIDKPKDLEHLMHQIKADHFGIKIMVPKGINHLIKINSVSNIAANILKQEMLSFGGEVAVARNCLTGRTKSTDCLLMGNLSQINRLSKKLIHQPFGLSKLADELTTSLLNYQKENFNLDLGKYRLNLGKRPLIMGILNLTPDSFSGDGFYGISHIAYRISHIIDFVEKMVKDGADIIDIGGESSRPGAKPISLKEELSRTIPIIKILVKRIKVPISIDTYKPQVAQQALDNGVSIVNDITGLRDPKMIKVIFRYNCGVVIMHMKGKPCTMQNNPVYNSLIDEVIEFLRRAINTATKNGVSKDKIIIDPGIGFGKTAEHNLQILKRLKEFKILGRPILVGPSRKSFIGKILNVGPQERIFGTVASCILAVENGAKILRVHDIRQVKEALKVQEAINNT